MLPLTAFVWRFNKAIGTNSLIQFRVDNLRINELPVPTLHFEPYDATHILIWWDNIFGNDLVGTVLYENDSNIGNPLAWVPSTGTTLPSDPLRYGKIYPLNQQAKFFRRQASGSPAL